MDLDSGQAASLSDGGDTDVTVPDHSVKRTKDNSYEEEVSYPLNVYDTRGISCYVRLHLENHCKYTPALSIPPTYDENADSKSTIRLEMDH